MGGSKANQTVRDWDLVPLSIKPQEKCLKHNLRHSLRLDCVRPADERVWSLVIQQEIFSVRNAVLIGIAMYLSKIPYTCTYQVTST